MLYTCKNCGHEWWKPDYVSVVSCPKCKDMKLSQRQDDDEDWEEDDD